MNTAATKAIEDSEPTPRELANRANAAKSTGPKTPEGKRKSSQNATTTALTGRTVLLAADDLDDYERHLKSYHHKWEPLTADENALVQSIADTDWRLHRIPHLIMALEAKGREELADAFGHLDRAARNLRVELETHLKYEKQFRNFQLQETRLHRRREKDVAALRTVQMERNVRRGRELDVASKLYLAAEHDGQPFHPVDHGFDFSNDDVLDYLRGRRAAAIAREAYAVDRSSLTSRAVFETAASE